MRRELSLRSPFVPVVILCAVATISVVLLVTLRQQSDETTRSFIVLFDGVHQARQSVAHALFQHEQASAGIETVETQLILHVLEGAIDDLHAIIAGQSTLTSIQGIPLEDPELLAMLHEYSTAIRGLEDVLRSSYTGSGDVLWRDLGEERRRVGDLDARAAQVVARMNVALDEALRRNSASFLLTLLTWVLLLLGSIVGAYVQVRRRLHNEHTLTMQSHFLDSTNDAIIATDSEDRVVYWNKGAEKLYGWKSEEVSGMNLDSILHPSPSAEGDDEEHLQRDGRLLTVATSRTALGGSDADEELVVRVHRDITLRRRAEESVRRLAQLIDLTGEAMMVRDANDRILLWNKGAERMYGWSAEEVTGKRACDLIVPEADREVFESAMTKTLQTGGWEAEMEQLRKDGRRMVVHCRWTLLKEWHGQSDVRLVVNRDVTERKDLEVKFQRVAKLESLGSLAGGIVHDLNNILSPVFLGVELLQSYVKDQKIGSTLEMMSRSLERGRRIVNQVLTFVRGAEDTHHSVSVNQVLQELREIVNSTFPRSIRFSVSCPPGIRSTLGDLTQLNQVFMNLAVNARDAMPNGGELKISVENVSVPEGDPPPFAGGETGEYVSVSFSDTGAGIPKEHLERIFEPFFTTKEVGKGTGLGLATASDVVKSHGGAIAVKSEVGKGTTFTIFLRAAHPSEGRPTSPDQRVSQSKAVGRVLVVEDETYVRAITAEILKSHGMEVIEAVNGEEGLEMFKRHSDHINVILTDIDMPLMDGRQMISEIRVIRPDVVVIVASGSVDLGERIEGVHHLTKPYTIPQLIGALELALKGSDARIG